MSSNNLKPHCMEVPNPMIRADTSARDKYESYKEEQGKFKRKESNDAQVEILHSEFKEVHQKSEHLLKKEALLDKDSSLMYNELSQYIFIFSLQILLISLAFCGNVLPALTLCLLEVYTGLQYIFINSDLSTNCF